MNQYRRPRRRRQGGFRRTSQGEYIRDYTFDQAYELRRYDRNFRPTSFGEYNRDYTFNEAYNRSSADRDLRLNSQGEYNRDFTFNRAYERAESYPVFPRNAPASQSEQGQDLRIARLGPNWQSPGPHRGVGPRGYLRPDERICEEANERLTRHGQIDAGDIHVDVADGVVTLSGTVSSRRVKRMAEDSLETIKGVRDIFNELRIRQDESR